MTSALASFFFFSESKQQLVILSEARGTRA